MKRIIDNLRCGFVYPRMDKIVMQVQQVLLFLRCRWISVARRMDHVPQQQQQQTFDPWPQPTAFPVDFRFENDFTPAERERGFQPDGEYVRRLGEYRRVIT